MRTARENSQGGRRQPKTSLAHRKGGLRQHYEERMMRGGKLDEGRLFFKLEQKSGGKGPNYGRRIRKISYCQPDDRGDIQDPAEEG